jgi:thimet oligopeptidase
MHTFQRSFLSALAGAGLLAFTGAALAAPPALQAPGPAFPQFVSAEAVKAACDRSLAQAAAGLKVLERHPANGRWLAAQDAYTARVEDSANPLLFLSAVHPDKALRDAAEACELRWNDFFSTLGQNERLYQAARALKPADETDRLLQKTLVDEFEDAGVGLPPTQRARAKQLSDRIGELNQTFDRNIRDANVKLAFTEAELKGVPDAVWKDAKRDGEGRVLLGLDYPTFGPVMQLAESSATRERMWRAKTNEGGDANLKLLAEITQLRKEYAGLFGAASWADFVIRRRMAETPAKVQAFLGEVKTALQARERDEVLELRQAKASHLGQALDSTQMARWDVSFYTERVRRARYAVDQEAFRAYFPPQESLQFSLRLIERLMGVRYQRVPGAKAWHPDVQTYAVSDAATGKPLATLWVDLYPREGKYNHAAVWGLYGGSALQKRPSQAALVVNFDRKGLTLDELETLLHELGHAVHNNLTTARHVQQAGTRVQRDFVEAPSQMLEDWVYDKQVLKLFAQVCPSCTPVPDALIDKAVAARHFGKGLGESRQHLYASYDLALYGPEPRDPMALWAQMEGDTPLGHVPGTLFPAGFSHIAGGYSAGYYGYLWSKVVALDLRTAFAADKLNPAVGRRYRDTVLANGSQRKPAQLVHDFLGRDFNAKAFFEELKK